VAVVSGWLTERGTTRAPLRTADLMVVGNAVISRFGAPYLAVAIVAPRVRAIELGVLPFLLGDAVKVAFAAGLFQLA
jgi:biotin transport system substrate-specific component